MLFMEFVLHKFHNNYNIIFNEYYYWLGNTIKFICFYIIKDTVYFTSLSKQTKNKVNEIIYKSWYLVKLINADNTPISKHHGSCFQATLTCQRQ